MLHELFAGRGREAKRCIAGCSVLRGLDSRIPRIRSTHDALPMRICPTASFYGARVIPAPASTKFRYSRWWVARSGPNCAGAHRVSIQPGAGWNPASAGVAAPSILLGPPNNAGTDQTVGDVAHQGQKPAFGSGPQSAVNCRPTQHEEGIKNLSVRLHSAHASQSQVKTRPFSTLRLLW